MATNKIEYQLYKRFSCTPEFKEFKEWCEKNHKRPIKLLKAYCRFTVLTDMDLTENKNILIF